MPSIDKQSVRDEFDKIKAGFEQQVTAGKVSTETATLVNALFMLFNIVLSIFMEKATKKNSTNSSIPPSQTTPDDTTLPDKKDKTNSKGHTEEQTMAGNTRTVETVEIIPVLSCKKCGADLSYLPCECTERRTKIDIIFEKTVEHVDVEIKTCSVCLTENKASFPKDMQGPLQYGNGIKAYVISLLVAQMVAVNRVAKMMSSLIGQLLSEATLLGYVMRLYVALEGWETETKEQLLTTQCINVDETSCRVDKKNHWIHVYSSGGLTLKFLHEKRGKKAINDIGLIPRYRGTIVHDCWASYLAYGHLKHGLCGSHLLRELAFIIETNGYHWAKNMKRLLRTACKMVSNSSKKQLSTRKYLQLQRIYQKIIAMGEKELPLILTKTTKKRGRIAKSDAHNLFERFKKHEDAVLLFAKKSYVSFTNNRAERDLRMTKVKQKVSGCFRTEKYAKAYCRISSYLQTMAHKGFNPLIAISLALDGKIPA